MPSDATNMPMRRDAPFREMEGGALVAVAGEAVTPEHTLRLESMLLEEFNYASVTAYQAIEDRARMFNLYLLLIGVVASAVGAILQLGKSGSGGMEPLVVALLAVGALLSVVFFVNVIRLRQAWRDSAVAMNCVKEFYIRQFKDTPFITGAFHWRLRTIPTKERMGSVTSLVCSTIALLGSICLGAAVYIACRLVVGDGGVGWAPLPGGAQPVALGGLLSVVFLVGHVGYYQRTLSRAKELKATQAAAAALGISLEA